MKNRLASKKENDTTPQLASLSWKINASCGASVRDKLSDVETAAEVNTQDTHVSLDIGNPPLLQRDNTKDLCVERNAQPASHYHR